MAIFRPSTWGNNNSEDGLDSRTIGIIVAVVSVSILSAMVLCVCVRRRRRVKSCVLPSSLSDMKLINQIQ